MTRRALVDINVLLDVLADRQPFADAAEVVWSLAETGQVCGVVSADSFTTLYYLLRRASTHRQALRSLRLTADIFEIAALDTRIIQQAMSSVLKDFEDAVQYHTSVHVQADCLVTRDLKHFRQATLPVVSPDEFVGWLAG